MIDYVAQPSVQEACARLFTEDAEIGTGYLVAPDRIATCYHLVAKVEKDIEPIDCRFGQNGDIQRKAYLLAVDPSTDSAILRLEGPVPATPLALLAGPIDKRIEFWVLGFPGFTADNVKDIRKAVTLHGIITNFHQVSPDNIADTMELSIEDFKGQVPDSIGGSRAAPY